jgi:hypothetical protein
VYVYKCYGGSFASIFGLIHRVQTVAPVFFNAEECQYALFQQAVYWTYSKGSRGCCEGSIWEQNLLAVVCGQHAPVASTHMTFICGELLGKELAGSHTDGLNTERDCLQGDLFCYPGRTPVCE